MFKFYKSLLVIAAVAGLTPLASFATPVPVTTNPSLFIDGLNFGSFNCSVTKGGILAQPNNCGQIKVGTITSPGVGLEFNSGFTAGAFSFDDAVITYNVSAGSGINSVGLDFNGTFLGLAISSVTESVFSGNQLVGTAHVACDLLACNETDTITLDGSYTNLHIEKDINVTGSLGYAQASIVDQTFGVDAPEPASLALFGSGLLGLAALLRRRVKSGNNGKGATEAQA